MGCSKTVLVTLTIILSLRSMLAPVLRCSLQDDWKAHVVTDHFALVEVSLLML